MRNFHLRTFTIDINFAVRLGTTERPEGAPSRRRKPVTATQRGFTRPQPHTHAAPVRFAGRRSMRLRSALPVAVRSILAGSSCGGGGAHACIQAGTASQLAGHHQSTCNHFCVAKSISISGQEELGSRPLLAARRQSIGLNWWQSAPQQTRHQDNRYAEMTTDTPHNRR